MGQSSRAINGCISHQFMAPQSISSPQSHSSLSRPPTPVFELVYIATPGLCRLGVGSLLALGYFLIDLQRLYLGRWPRRWWARYGLGEKQLLQRAHPFGSLRKLYARAGMEPRSWYRACTSMDAAVCEGSMHCIRS